MKIGELFVDLFVKTDDTKLKDFIHNLGELRMSSLLNTIGLDQVYEGVKKIMEVADRTALSINNFSKVTGQSAKDFQQWGAIASQVGQDASVVGSSVTHLVDSVTRLNKFGENAGFWGQAFPGLDPRKMESSFEILTEIGKRLDGLSVSEKRFKLGLLGLDPALIPILDYVVHNQAEVAKQMAVSAESAAKLEKFHRAIARLAYDWNVLLTNLGAILAPVVEMFADIADFIVKISDGISHFIGPLMVVAGALLLLVGGLNPVLGALTRTAGIGLMGKGAMLTAGDIMGTMNPAISNSNSKVTNYHTTINATGSSGQEMGEHAARTFERYIIGRSQDQQHLPNN